MKLPVVLHLLGVLSAVSVLAEPQKRAEYYIPKDRVLIENEYLILLQPNHTIAAHFEVIGIDLENDQNSGFFHRLDTINGYFAKLDSHTVHDLIRFDPGVRIVEHNCQVEHIFGFDVKPVEHSSTEANATNAPPHVGKRWINTIFPNQGWHQYMVTYGKKIPYPFGYQDMVS